MGAAARRAARGDEEPQGEIAPLAEPELATVTLSSRPFGMTPSKTEGEGYLVVRVSDGKPAAAAGIRPGWRLASVSGVACTSRELEQLQGLLKEAQLPVTLEFEKLPNNGDLCTACQRVLVATLFSRKMRTKPADKRRCSACVDAADDATAEATGDAEQVATDDVAKPQSQFAEFKALVAESAEQAEKV